MNLTTKLSAIRGVGPKTAADLALAGFETASDLINFLPRVYDDFSKIEKISDLRPGKVTIKARAESVNTRIVRRGLRVTTAVLSDDSGKVSAVWFNQAYRQKQLERGEFYFSGEFKLSGNRYQLSNPSVELAKDLPVQTGRILPIYPKRKGLKPAVTRKILNELRLLISMLPENLPPEIVAREKLISRSESLLGLHFPRSKNDADLARERLSFEELFNLILAAKLNKNENSRLNGFEISFDLNEFKKILTKLPFALTAAQKKATWEIIQDFARADSNKVAPMNRLLQGDVGSGKTIVAGLAAFVVCRAGYQTAVMAPTEILATQHAETLQRLLESFEIKVALLTGSVKGKARTELLKQIENGSVQVVVGTHALFQPAVKFHNLGFAIIDEQHRFGVKQRQELLAKSSEIGEKPFSKDSPPSQSKTYIPDGTDGFVLSNKKEETQDGSAGCPAYDVFEGEGSLEKGFSPIMMPHLLSMTATPIPRSLQLTLFGDLDISILNELPKGRKPIKTEIISPVSRGRMNEKIAAELEQGRQAYFIAPLIENTGKSEKENVTNLFKKIAKEFKGIPIGVLHGKMPAETKEKVMRDFAEFSSNSGTGIQILVSTTVVEVGVDVPNASVIVIENADQFGLSQLHQLRGRTGRGDHQSYAFLVQSDSSAPSQRLREIERSNDGFYLAEVDLKLRGAGEIYGTAQHGALNLQIANLADTKLIKRAAAAATDFAEEIGQNPETLLKYPELAREVNKYQRLTTLN